MRRLNSDLSDKSSDKWKTSYLDIIAIGTIQFFLSTLILCYGVFILKDLNNLKTSLWTAVCFVACAKITNPWVRSYCKHLDNVRQKTHKRNIIITTIVLFVVLVVLSFYHTPTSIIIGYGVFGGVLSSIILVHLSFATVETFNPSLFPFMDQFTKSFSLLTTPYFILFLINTYDAHNTFLILSGIILNIIPACLLLHTKNYHTARLCKFQTIDKLSIEMTDMAPKSPIIQEPPSSSSSSSDESEEQEQEIEVDAETSVQKYFQNVGVKILPNIPEESDMEEDDDINEINSKRLSRISAILQVINKNSRRNSNSSVNNLFQPEEVNEAPEPEEDYVSEFSRRKSRCFSVNSSVIFNLQLKKRRIRSYCYRHFVRSIPRTLSTVYFYPALISSCITTTLSTIVLATAPHLVFFNHEHKYKQYKTAEESTFLLTMVGFSWLFFLAGYPVINRLSSLKIKILFMVGLAFLGLSLFIVHQFSYDNFVLFSLTFGLGHGIVSYADGIANQDFMGETKWKMLQGALEICCGIIVILVYLVIYLTSLEISVLLFYAYWLYVFDMGLWIVSYVTKKIFIYVKNTGRYNVERYPDYNF